MKLKDVLLITNNNKGTEYKYLSSMEDYMAILLRAFEGSETERLMRCRSCVRQRRTASMQKYIWRQIKPFMPDFAVMNGNLRISLGETIK